ncbi:Threonine/homoserine efflux transporter RhtA [Sphingomonas sp. YR710]|uniref:DMT family transporter n=1 Tax=Sphingomonas sp. YR710 TaxID=1882773 RepID=UPI000883D8CF|nr:DMT family transporter [Sphingomonas sp. YR710]SDC52105.1 Threonine/homoserine efflux transporter RhtA [Sphingomonas sp. YR710]
MLTKSPQLRAYVMLGFTMLFWAGNSIVGRAVRDDIPPITLALVRWTGALILLAPFALRPLIAEWPVVRRHWRSSLFLGIVGGAAFNGLLYSGLRYTTATNGLLLQALIPSLVLLVGAIGFRDRARVGQIIGIALSTIGVGLIVFRGDIAVILALHFGTGDMFILCGCVCWALYTACLRLRPAIQPITFVFVTFAISALAMVPFALGEAQAIAAMRWQPATFAAFAYVAIFPSIFAYFLYNAAVARIGPGAAGQTISLMPLFGALLATALLGENLAGYHMIGMALILTGIVVGWAIDRRRAP